MIRGIVVGHPEITQILVKFLVGNGGPGEFDATCSA